MSPDGDRPSYSELGMPSRDDTASNEPAAGYLETT
jgi:hypothetical protein